MTSKHQTAPLKNRILAAAILAVAFCALALPAPVFADQTQTSFPSLFSFVETVRDGNAESLRGIYVAGVMAYPIVQQPMGNPGFVSSNGNAVTQFSIAAEVGNIGLLAHNYLAGANFSQLKQGDTIVLIYGDGRTQSFFVEGIQQYQALQPFSPYSNFRDLETESILTAEQLFNKVYRGNFHLTLQTCIEGEGNLSWGRLFIVAKPLKEKALDLLIQRNREDLAIQ
jgi:hypothetical protein